MCVLVFIWKHLVCALQAHLAIKLFVILILIYRVNHFPQMNEATKRQLVSYVCAATALKMNMNLRELYLADNKLNGLQDSAQLGNLLKFNYNIQILDLRNNHILDSGLTSYLLLVSFFRNLCT